MPARCPHATEHCLHDGGDQCHYVISFKTSMAIVATRILKIELEEIPHEIGEHIKEIESMLVGMGRSQ